ncbi:hypothetical protein OBBRIDRAFT_885707 [Obba rivulosa]|uniref:DUF6534 domain-containing protein n=1 Tax=Obba rivulosa TaxID=1052685 RepID=A0A8E2DP63_9APHY|nr:hypothetical protein OBBRIDRAFT_885707 [Obba rivulosa]
MTATSGAMDLDSTVGALLIGVVITAVSLSASAAVGGFMVFLIKGEGLDSLEEFHSIATPYYIGAVFSVPADILLAGSQVVMLWRLRTGFKRTDTVMRTLMLYSINTGVLTRVVAAAGLITFALMPNSFVYVSIYHTNCKLNLNALLATYNTRSELREVLAPQGDIVTIPIAAATRFAGPNLHHVHNRRPAHHERIIEISVVTFMEMKADLTPGSPGSKTRSSGLA